MENGKLLVLVVCDGGFVISSMIVNKIDALFTQHEISASIVSHLPISVEAFAKQNSVDFIISSSPIPGQINVPIINGLPLLTGFKEQELEDQILGLAQEILTKDSGN